MSGFNLGCVVLNGYKADNVRVRKTANQLFVVRSVQVTGVEASELDTVVRQSGIRFGASIGSVESFVSASSSCEVRPAWSRRQFTVRKLRFTLPAELELKQ